MLNRSILCILLLFTLSYQTTFVLNLPQNFTPKDEAEYARYLTIMLGHYDESAPLSENIKQVMSTQRPTILNSPEKIVLIFATLSKQDESFRSQGGLNFSGNELKQLIQKYPSHFDTKIMLNANRERIQQEITDYQLKGIFVNVILGQQKEIISLQKRLASSKATQSKRRLQAQTSTDKTYLIKFFFSILFILVIVACVGFISQNDGKKDTLLYAKFIADVGSR